MKDRLRFSVVISNYNYAAFVAEAIDSALAQTQVAHQIIVVDDGSTDTSRELLTKSFGGNQAVSLIFQDNQGQLAALIAGISAATGDVICFLDADDVWAPDYLLQLAEVYRQQPEVDFVYGNLRFVGGMEGTWFRAELPSRDHGLTALECAFLEVWRGAPTSAISLRAPLARKLISLPRELWPDWRTRADDVLIYGSAIYGARKYFLSKVVASYRVHGSNNWLQTRESATEALLYRYQVKALIGHFSKLRSISPQHLVFLSSEFKTKPRPSWQEAKNYLCIAARNFWAIGPVRSLNLMRSVLAQYARTRRRGYQPPSYSNALDFPRDA